MTFLYGSITFISIGFDSDCDPIGHDGIHRLESSTSCFRDRSGIRSGVFSESWYEFKF